MARLPRISPLGIPQHIVQRGNNGQVCFGSEEDIGLLRTLVSRIRHRIQNTHTCMGADDQPCSLVDNTSQTPVLNSHRTAFLTRTLAWQNSPGCPPKKIEQLHCCF